MALLIVGRPLLNGNISCVYWIHIKVPSSTLDLKVSMPVDANMDKKRVAAWYAHNKETLVKKGLAEDRKERRLGNAIFSPKPDWMYPQIAIEYPFFWTRSQPAKAASASFIATSFTRKARRAQTMAIIGPAFSNPLASHRI